MLQPISTLCATLLTLPWTVRCYLSLILNLHNPVQPLASLVSQYLACLFY